MAYDESPMRGSIKYDNQVTKQLGKVVHVAPAADGTVVAPTVTLTYADAGNYYFVNIGTYTAAFVLPKASTCPGGIFTFILDINSDAEATKDLIVASYAATEYIIGTCLDAGAVHDTSVADDQIMFDSSAGAIGGGDRLRMISDGNHWYILEGIALAANAFVSGTATRS